MLDTLATVLLRIRDKHYEAVDPRGTAANLAEELILATNFSYYEEQMEEQRQNNKGLNPNNLKTMHDVPKQAKSFHSFKQQREFLGKELLYRALPDHSSRLNISPQKGVVLNYDRVGSGDAEDIFNELENGEGGRDSFEHDVYRSDRAASHDSTEDTKVEKFFRK